MNTMINGQVLFQHEQMNHQFSMATNNQYAHQFQQMCQHQPHLNRQDLLPPKPFIDHSFRDREVNNRNPKLDISLFKKPDPIIPCLNNKPLYENNCLNITETELFIPKSEQFLPKVDLFSNKLNAFSINTNDNNYFKLNK